ncbi:MAG: ABC transporter ATP-binding protein [Ignavibacteriae bacterium]|nr:ABC transporter ATP-binding protein [Ignavibacteriota bacterium]
MIEISNLTKRYKNIIALDGVSLEIKSGEFFGLLGPNGAGKSTLMNLLAGYIEADSGSIKFDNEVFSRDSIQLRKKIGLAPQSLALYDDVSAETNLKIFGSLYLMNKNELKNIIKEKLDTAGLYERRKDHVKTFSGGMKRRLNLIAALLHSPEVLLCDEPTVGVDPQSRNAIFDFLQKINDEENITIIYTTHYMEEAERLCKRIAIIDMGKIIAQGTKDELLNMLQYKEEIFISKNEKTTPCINSLSKTGEITEFSDKYVVKVKGDIKMSEIFKLFEESGIDYSNIDFQRPTIEELFLNLTGKRLRD